MNVDNTRVSHQPHWLIPFRGRNHSGASTQNFLWREGNAYIMDNHRAAMWCWLQELTATDVVGLLHIDEHYDTLYANIDAEIAALPALGNTSIQDYLNLTIEGEEGHYPLIRWDNYLSLFLELYGNQIHTAIFVTHNVGDKPKHRNVQFRESVHLPGNLAFWMTSYPGKWIINVDLDYFFCDQEGTRKPLFSDSYVATLFRRIRFLQQTGRVQCLTICLSPDEGYAGSWHQAEELCQFICQIADLKFCLPS